MKSNSRCAQALAATFMGSVLALAPTLEAQADPPPRARD